MDCQLAMEDGNLRFGASSRHLKVYKEVGTGTAALAIWLSIAYRRVTAKCCKSAMRLILGHSHGAVHSSKKADIASARATAQLHQL